MAMRDVIKKAILEGGATKESLLELTGTTDKGLASQFTYLRMMGTCPMKQADNTFKIVSPEEWEEHRSAGGASAANLTPEQLVDKAEKRSKRAASAYDTAKTRAEAKPEDRMLHLKFEKAKAELGIAEIELGLAETAFAEAPPEPVTDGGEEITDDADDAEEGELNTDELQ